MPDTDYLDAFCNTADGVYIVNAKQQIIRWNKGAERILKYSEGEVLNHDCYRIIAGRVHPDKLFCHAKCKVHCSVLRGSPPENFDLLTRSDNGEPLWLNVSIISSPSGSEPFMVHIVRDVTRERQAGQAVEQFLAALGAHGTAGEKLLEDRSGTKPAAARTSDTPPALSQREIEVLTLLAEGLSTKTLANRLNISHFTARNHIQNILVKLDLHSKAQAVSYAFKKGLLKSRLQTLQHVKADSFL